MSLGTKFIPELRMRLNAETSAKIGHNNAFKHLSMREVELKNLFISGMKGIKSVKTARKISYNYQNQEEMNLAL